MKPVLLFCQFDSREEAQAFTAAFEERKQELIERGQKVLRRAAKRLRTLPPKKRADPADPNYRKRPRPPWSPERRAKFMATMARKKGAAA